MTLRSRNNRRQSRNNRRQSRKNRRQSRKNRRQSRKNRKRVGVKKRGGMDHDRERGPADAAEEVVEERQVLEDDYFPTWSIPEIEVLAASAYHDRNPAQLSAILDPIAHEHNVTRDSIKNELIRFHEQMEAMRNNLD